MIPYRTGIVNWDELRRFFVRSVVMLGDCLMVAASYAAAFLIRFQSDQFLEIFPVTKGFPSPSDYLKASPVILFMWVIALSWQDSYKQIQMSALDEIIRMVRATATGILLATSAMFLYRDASFSRIVFIMGGVIAGALIYTFRQFLKMSYVAWVQRNRRPQRVLVIGEGYLANSLKKILERQGDRATLITKEIRLASVLATIGRSRIREVLLAHPEFPHRDAVRLAGVCEEKGIVFRLIPDILAIRMGEVIIDDSLGVPTFQIKPVSLQGLSFLTKRVMDVGVSSMLIGIFFFPLVLISLLIKLTSRGSRAGGQVQMGIDRAHHAEYFRASGTEKRPWVKPTYSKSPVGVA